MSEQERMRLALTGDSIITRRGAISLDEPTREVVELLTEADVSFTNLEVLPSDFAGYPAWDSGGSHFSAHHWVVDEMLDMGINLFGAANNHALDYSIEGLVAAIEVLESKDVPFSGIGRNLEESRMPTYIDTPMGSVGLISCCSTFVSGQQAGAQSKSMVGRPGLNPLRFDTTYYITKEQYESLKNISLSLGIEQARLEKIGMGFAFGPDDPEVLPFLGGNFKIADESRVETTPKERDVAEIEQWVWDAKRRSDCVIVSLHAHEPAPDDKEKPAQFLEIFARRMIEAGADVIAGHGPHLIRGMEVYKGRPIFYSLGNFFGQNELVWRVPADGYERFRVDPSLTPMAVYDSRHSNDEKSFPADARYWESVMPLTNFDGDSFSEMEIVPLWLNLQSQPNRRGRPQVAHGEIATRILERFQKLSEPYGAKMRIEGERAFVEIS
jgi:hypothetical protein